jgi:hypothetical protein
VGRMVRLNPTILPTNPRFAERAFLISSKCNCPGNVAFSMMDALSGITLKLNGRMI